MKQFHDVHAISRSEAEKALSSGNPEKICQALLSVSFHETDWKWAQENCLRFLENEDPEISGLAAICLGHIARIHKLIDRDRVVSALRKHSGNPGIAGQIEDAIEDIEKFASD